jgi:hypothetical protein
MKVRRIRCNWSDCFSQTKEKAMRFAFASGVCLLMSAVTLHAEPKTLTVFNYSGIDTFVVDVRGKHTIFFPVPKDTGNVVTTTMAKDKSDRVFAVYNTDKTATDISDPAIVAGLGTVKVTTIPGEGLAVYIMPGDKPDKVDLVFWSDSKGKYTLVGGQNLKGTFDQTAAIKKMEEGAKTAVPLESIGP